MQCGGPDKVLDTDEVQAARRITSPIQAPLLRGGRLLAG
jgi:hypothetical protein